MTCGIPIYVIFYKTVKHDKNVRIVALQKVKLRSPLANVLSVEIPL